MPLIIDALREGGRPIVSAIMGAGKSILIGELCYIAYQRLRPDTRIVVLCPRQALVQQLVETFNYRMSASGVEQTVGSFWAQSKQVDRPIIVATFASSLKLAERMEVEGLRCAMLVGDEVHGTESDVVKEAIERLSPACAIGFTATPFRSNEHERLTLWDRIAYSYSASDALRDKVIVPWEIIHYGGGKKETLDDVCADLMDKAIFETNGPGIVSALDIEDAVEYGYYLCSRGIKAKAIHSRVPPEERDRLIEELKDGHLKCLVHVNLLSEGVNLPWLRWLCLRRPVGAKVRFVQEVGRVLRAHPSKSKAWICDPHDLMTSHGLVHPEQIGELLIRQEIDEYEEELMKLAPDEDQAERVRKLPAAKAFSEIESYLVNLRSAMAVHGFVKPDLYQEDPQRRGGYPTQSQLRAIENLKWTTRYLPKEIREPFKLLCAQAPNFKRGDCSRMISIMHGLAKGSKDSRRRKRHWNMPRLSMPLPDFTVQQLLFSMKNN